jgi:GTPase SAR1 family protein
MSMKELKVLFSGLSNAGKTSILKVLDNDLASIPDLAPTFGAQISTYKPMGIETHVWDMGGQSRYRQKYLLEYEKYFAGTNVIFYVIDVQAPETFKESLNYLKQVIEVMAKLDLKKAFVAILLHKYDPHIIRDRKLENKLKNLWTKIRLIVNKFLFSVYRTSMYDPHTIFQAFSEAILHPFTEAQIFTQKIKEFATEYNSPAAAMIATGGFTYGKWNAESIDVADLYKFNTKVQELARYMNIYRDIDFRLTPLTESTSFAAFFFDHKDDYVMVSIIVPNGQDEATLQEEFAAKRKEYLRVLEVFDDVRFGANA